MKVIFVIKANSKSYEHGLLKVAIINKFVSNGKLYLK